jgi:hypothetical protein
MEEVVHLFGIFKIIFYFNFSSTGRYFSDRPKFGIVRICFEPFEFGFFIPTGLTPPPVLWPGPACQPSSPRSDRACTRARHDARAHRPRAVAARPLCWPPRTPLPHLLSAWCHPGSAWPPSSAPCRRSL